MKNQIKTDYKTPREKNMKTNRNAFVLFVLMGLFGWIFILASCEGVGFYENSKLPPITPEIKIEQQDVSDSAKTVGEVGKNIDLRADKIDIHADAIDTKIPPDIKSVFKPEVDGIKNETQGLRQDSATLFATEQKLKNTELMLSEQQKNIEKYTSYARESETQRVKLQDKIKELKSENAEMLKTMLSWVTICCVIGIGASLVIGFFFKTPAAFMVAAGCVATMGVAIAVTIYLQQIAWIALVLIGVGSLAAAIYVFMQIKNRDKAVKELIHTGEIAKTYLPISVREKIFGNSVEPGVAHQVQSNTTMNLVRGVRELDKVKRGYGLAPEIPKFWKPTTGDMFGQAITQDPYKSLDITLLDHNVTTSPKTIIG